MLNPCGHFGDRDLLTDMQATLIQQVARPSGRPEASQFKLVQETLAPIQDGEALVQNLYLSVDPYMREVMDDGDLNAPQEGRALGRVVQSRAPELAEGQIVAHRQGWRSHAIVTPSTVRRLTVPAGVGLTAYLGMLGGTGLSAYVGLTRIAKVQPGETVFITGAAGGVGSAAGQIARLLGAAQVIGSTGSPAKARYLVQRLGFDAALNYREGDLPGQLAKAAPGGVDVCLENVGGDHLAAAIANMRDRGRITWCGAVSQYSATSPTAAPHNLFDIVGRQLRLEGFLVRDYTHLQSELEDFLVPHIRSGHVSTDETIVDGLENMTSAFLSMLDGANTGKMIVRVM